MFRLMEGCRCPQKSVYIILGLGFIIFNIGILINLNNKNINTNKFLQRFLLNIILIILVFKLLEILCDKKYNNIAWFIAILPLVNFLILGMGFSEAVLISRKINYF
jgi:hypothetical protein